MRKKEAFMLTETLISSGIFSMIALIGISVISLITFTLFSGQTESTNRSNLNETIFYLTREVQSAEGIRITEDGKCLEIKGRGRSGYNLKYSISEGYPSDYLAFNNKRLFDIDAETSRFCFENGLLRIELGTVKNNIEVNQREMPFVVTVKPRSTLFGEAE